MLSRLAIDGRPVETARGTGIGSYAGQLIRAVARVSQADLDLVWTPNEPHACLMRPARYWPMGKDDWAEQNMLPAWLAERHTQVYHLVQNGFGWPRRSPVPFVVTLHDVIPYLLPEYVRPSYLSRFLAEIPGMVKAAARIITVSERAKADICRVFEADPDKIAVIPSGPAAVFHRRDRAVAARILERRYGLRGRFILYVGGYNPRKNVAGLVTAFAGIVRRLPDRQRLVLAGAGGPHCDRLRALAAALGIEREVIFPGFIPRRHLPLFYTAADLFCYPSLYEGFGLPPLEAMACGTPVVAANSSSIPTVLGPAAILVPPHDTHGMGLSMFEMLTDPELAAEYVRRGLNQVKKYHWNDIARRVIKVYEEVI